MKNFKKIFAILLATFMIGVSTPIQFTANTQTDEITINQEIKTEQTDEVTITDNTNEQNQEEEQLTELNKDSDQQENAPPKAPTYEQGEYDILVPHDGELKHPKDIEGFEFNNGQYPDYPLGWLNGLMETRMAPFNSTITMGVQIGYVDGNGYRTFMNELYDNGGLGFCAERGKDPISNSSNYNDGILDTSKKTDAIYVAYNDAYGIMGTTNHEYKFGVAQAGVWFFEGTLEYNATVVVHGHGDVSGKFRQVVDKVNAIWDGSDSDLDFTKTSLTTSYDASTNTLVTEQFRYTDASFDRDASISLAPGFYITKASDNVAVDHLNKNQDFVIRTTDLRASGTINLTASITMEKPVGKLFSHLTMADTFQAILTFSHTDPTSRSATLNATFEPATGGVEIPKTHQNLSSQTYPYDFSKYTVEAFNKDGVSVGTTTVGADGYAKFTDLLLGDYTYIETVNDPGIVAVKGSGAFTILPGETVTLTSSEGLLNEVLFASLEGTKKDADWLTAILKGSKFGLYDKSATGGVGNLIMEANTNYFTGKFNFNNIQITSKGYRDVLVCELEAPDGYFRATTCKEIRLLPGNHKNVIEFDFYNVPENEMSAEAIKYNHKGEVMGGISLKYEQIDGLGGNVVKLIETLKTNTDGFARFKNVPVNDENNQLLCYRITELRTEENKHFILAEPYEFCGNKDVKIVAHRIINEPKKVIVPIWKIAELNPVGITADGSEWGLYNSKNELIGSVIIKDGYAELVDLTYEALGEDISTNYWQEITPGNDALVLDTTKYYLPATDWNHVEDGDSITVEGNSADTPFINTIKTIRVAGFKYNEYKQPLEHVEWGEFAEDVTAQDGTITKKMVEKVSTDATGYFEFSEQKIYMFNGKELDYAQELSTKENLVLLTEHIQIPEIAAADYGKYKDGEILYLSTEQAPIINYQLRGSIEWWKANEDFVFLPNTQYTLYDGDKYQLATIMTDENGHAKIDNINIVLFFNKENPDSEFSTTYLRETATANEDEYDLDYAKYYLPNLQKQVTAGELEMDFVIQLSTQTEPFINDFLRGDIRVVKVDEALNELKLPNTTMKFERLTGADKDIVEEITSINETTSVVEETTQANEETTNTIEDITDSSIIDVKQTFELTTDANGEIQYDAALYGDWCVTEIKAPEGYILPVDANGVPTNKICFTIDNENRHIALKFYNQKAPAILAETGEHTTLWIAFSIQLLLIFGYLLFKVRKHKKMKQAGTLALLLVTLFYFPSVTMQAATPTLPQPKLTQEAPASIKSNVVDPTVPSPETPIDGLPETPPTMPETPIDGTRPDPTAPPVETVTPSPAGGEGAEEEGEEYPTTTATSSSSYLANAGEQLAIPIISGLTIMIASIILFERVQWYKKRKH